MITLISLGLQTYKPPKGKPAPRKTPEQDEARYRQAYGNRLRREIVVYLTSGSKTTSQVADMLATSNQAARQQLKKLEAEGSVEIVTGAAGTPMSWRIKPQ